MKERPCSLLMGLSSFFFIASLCAGLGAQEVNEIVPNQDSPSRERASCSLYRHFQYSPKRFSHLHNPQLFDAVTSQISVDAGGPDDSGNDLLPPLPPPSLRVVQQPGTHRPGTVGDGCAHASRARAHHPSSDSAWSNLEEPVDVKTHALRDVPDAARQVARLVVVVGGGVWGSKR